MLIQAIRDPDPVLFIEPARLYRKHRRDVPDDAYTVPFGRARIVCEGTDVTLVSWSAAVEVCEEATVVLADEGISIELIDLRSFVPLDVDTIVNSACKTGRCVVVHEAPLSAGFGAEIVSTVQEGAFYSLDAPIARVTGYDTPYPLGAMEDAWLPSVDRIVRAVRKSVAA